LDCGGPPPLFLLPPPPVSTANHANHAKIETEFPFVFLASFAVHSASTLSELFSFCAFTQRSPTASANAGLKAATALRLVGRAVLCPPLLPTNAFELTTTARTE
jgi:hypothetical protein